MRKLFSPGDILKLTFMHNKYLFYFLGIFSEMMLKKDYTITKQIETQLKIKNVSILTSSQIF